MSYISDRLPRGEEIRYSGRISWIPFVLRSMVLLVVLSFVAGCVWGITDDARLMAVTYLVGVIVWALSLLKTALRIVGTEMVITNSHIHSKTGIVRIDNDRETSLDKIDRVDIDKHKVVQRIFDFGDIEFQTVGSDSGFFLFKDVAHPYEMKDAYNAAKYDYEQRLRRETEDTRRDGSSVPRRGTEPDNPWAEAGGYGGVRHHGSRERNGKGGGRRISAGGDR